MGDTPNPSCRGRGRYRWVLSVITVLAAAVGVRSGGAHIAAAPALATEAECYPATHEPALQAEHFKHVGRVPLAAGTTEVGGDVELVARPNHPRIVYQATSGGFRVIDLSDVTRPCVIARATSRQPAPGPAFYPRLAVHNNLLALASQNETRDVRTDGLSFEGLELFDVTDPARPRFCDSAALPVGAHSLAFDPVRDVLYATTSNQGGDAGLAGLYVLALRGAPTPGCRSLELVARFLTAPREGTPSPCSGVQSPCATIDKDWRPHDVYVPADDRSLRYVAASRGTYLVDVSGLPDAIRVKWAIPQGEIPKEEEDPRFYHRTPHHSHDSRVSPDGRWLVVGDEVLQADGSCPGGGLHIYDLKTGEPPQLAGRYFAPYVGPRTPFCTVHYFEFLQGRNVVVASWYGAGVWLVDIAAAPGANEFAAPEEVGVDWRTSQGRSLGHAIMPSADAQAVEVLGPCRDVNDQNRFLVITADGRRGLDIFSYTGPFEALGGPFPRCP